MSRRREHWRGALERDLARAKRGETRHPGVMGLLVYGGSVGLLFVLPVVAGAYLGQWLDSMNEPFSSRWTLSLILLGIVAGIINVMLYLRRLL